ncbi:uncharacterized protein LOC122081302 isoform X2 [Macadamia integrifolia]|uniref:uncharacterized protein LOC122081302 isoform X2 n=1 Tax=Macadamia integrifolia TaxID=60698 RepID=UPI001C4F3980|nr:uncharacterized protein LOC122081302 isoform X2 [Macadamia integrifolia]
MADPLRSRKRVYGLRRASDGSAFEKCDFCGVSFAIALADMHECKAKTEHKRLKAANQNRNPRILIVEDQPRSPFCCFMESFRKTHNFNYLEEDRKGFETWKNMTPEERSPFVLLSKMVDLKYDEVLLKEVDELEFQADDEADSLGFENFDLDHGFSNGWDSINSEGFDSSEWSQE